MMRIASEFGFTPASRSRIATPSSHEPSLFDKLEYPEADLGASHDPDGSTPSPLPPNTPRS
jgi:phage terminase small subunit